MGRKRGQRSAEAIERRIARGVARRLAEGPLYPPVELKARVDPPFKKQLAQAEERASPPARVAPPPPLSSGSRSPARIARKTAQREAPRRLRSRASGANQVPLGGRPPACATGANQVCLSSAAVVRNRQLQLDRDRSLSLKRRRYGDERTDSDGVATTPATTAATGTGTHEAESRKPTVTAASSSSDGDETSRTDLADFDPSDGEAGECATQWQ